MKLAFAFLVSVSVFAQDASKPPADPITDRMRYELRTAQLEYVLSQQRIEKATAVLRAKSEEVQKVCADQGKTFSVDLFTCVEKSK